MARAIPDARFIVVRDAGHMTPLEQPLASTGHQCVSRGARLEPCAAVYRGDSRSERRRGSLRCSPSLRGVSSSGKMA